MFLCSFSEEISKGIIVETLLQAINPSTYPNALDSRDI